MDNELIDRLLDKHRPDRYAAGDNSWRDPVYAAVAIQVTVAQARHIAAQHIVDQREGQATRQANALLREVGRTKQWPLDWMDVDRRPLSIGGDRVRLDAVEARDLREWELEERRRAASEFVACNQACDGAKWLADEMDGNGWSTFADACAALQAGAA